MQIISTAADGLEVCFVKPKISSLNGYGMGLSLSGINGIDATCQIRVDSSRSKVLFLSAS